MSATASATATKTEMDSLLTQIEHHADSTSGSARQFLARILLTMFLIAAVLLFLCLIATRVWFGWETGSWPDPFT